MFKSFAVFLLWQLLLPIFGLTGFGQLQQIRLDEQLFKGVEQLERINLDQDVDNEYASDASIING